MARYHQKDITGIRKKEITEMTNWEKVEAEFREQLCWERKDALGEPQLEVDGLPEEVLNFFRGVLEKETKELKAELKVHLNGSECSRYIREYIDNSVKIKDLQA